MALNWTKMDQSRSYEELENTAVNFHLCIWPWRAVPSISALGFFGPIWPIAHFTVNFSHLHNNVFKRGCETTSGRNTKIVRNCLTSTFKNIVMQMRKVNCEKGYCIIWKLVKKWKTSRFIRNWSNLHSLQYLYRTQILLLTRQTAWHTATSMSS